MILHLLRNEHTPIYTMGRLYITPNSKTTLPSDAAPYYFCDTLEPPVLSQEEWSQRVANDIAQGGTGKDVYRATPAGTYDLSLTRSPRFRRMLPIVNDVPGRSGIRIHRGNAVRDTKGCILLGSYVGNGKLSHSTPRELALVARMLSTSEANFITIFD